jgi:hypothetical protein
MSNLSLIGLTLAGPAVAGIVAYLLARWQLGRATSAARGSARILYLEIIYNLSMLNEGLKVGSNQPWFNDQAWQAHQSAVATIMPEATMARVATPYLYMAALHKFFAQSDLELFLPRLKGDDLRLLEQLRGHFIEAEAALRGRVWSRKPRGRLTTQLARHEMKFTVPTQGNRLIGAIAGVATGRVLQTLVSLVVLTHSRSESQRHLKESSTDPRWRSQRLQN